MEIFAYSVKIPDQVGDDEYTRSLSFCLFPLYTDTMASLAQPVSVNLLEQSEFESSVFSRLITWAVTYGRYIMIGTEIIVLIAFISRFKLDRQLTDLREEISQKQIILEANKGFEDDFKKLQVTMSRVQGILDVEAKPISFFYQMAEILPSDVTILGYEQTGAIIELTMNAGTSQGLSTFLTKFQKLPLANVEVTDMRKDALRGIQFHIKAKRT